MTTATQNEILKHDLLTDSLGILSPRLSLLPIERSEPGQHVPAVHGWTLESVTEQLGRGRACWKSFEQAVADLEASGYSVEVGLNGYNHKRARVTHLATLAEYRRQQAADESKWADARECYVRFGDLPEAGHSRNHADGTAEAGVSVFRGQVLPNGEARPLPASNQVFCSMVNIMSRPLYVVEGDEIGTGADGEPVLSNCRIIAQAN